MSDRLIPLTTSGSPHNLPSRIVAKITTKPISDRQKRLDYIYISDLSNGKSIDLEGYQAILTTNKYVNKIPEQLKDLPILSDLRQTDHLVDGDIVSINNISGFMRTMYRVNSRNNVIFATDRCNSLCLMCSQPPKKVNDQEKVQENIKLIKLIDPKPDFLGISGGEPTLLEEGLFDIKRTIKEYLPETNINMLTNGRMFCYEDFTKEFASIDHPSFCSAIPVYSDIPDHHDNVVQSEGAFIQTMQGLYNLASYRQLIEIRVVIHKLTYKRLPQLAKFIYKNLPFSSHIALMGLEIMGLTKMNLDDLWIDPVDYQDELYQAVQFLDSVGMHVSIYNHQLCILKRELHPFARQSISDFKNIYIDECERCDIREKCGGLFKSASTIHSKHIKAVKNS